MYFEWTLSPPNQVTVQISESSDEEDLEEEEGEGSDLFVFSSLLYILFLKIVIPILLFSYCISCL